MKVLQQNEFKRLEEKTKASQVYFNPLTLFVYDFFLYRFISPFLWGCSTDFLVKRYDAYLGRKHLDVGVGTGFLLTQCKSKIHDLSLMDLSENCLRKSANRLKDCRPNTIRHNILKAPPDTEVKFDSIALNYVMHCVVGDFSLKSVAFRNLKSCLKSNGLLFGVTVLENDNSNILARCCNRLLNLMGVFNNKQDSLVDLDAGLRRFFKYVSVEARASVILFVATDSQKVYEEKIATRILG